jgi:glycosyltransferase involved in cell wall biosynthesis
MRIGIDARLWNETGVGRYIRNLVGELQKCDKKNEYVLFVKNGFKIEDLGFKNKNWKIVPTAIHWHSVEEQVKFPQLLQKENLDLMHFPYFSLPVFYTKSFVVTIHDLIINHFPTGKASTLPYPLYKMKRIGYDFVMDHAVRNSKKIIVPLQAVKDDVLQTFAFAENKIEVTHEGSLNVSSQKQQTKPKFKNYFLYVGNAYPHKNLEKLIEGFVLFKKLTQEDVKLVLVGKDDYFYKHLEQKTTVKSRTDIVFRHDVTDEELFGLYSNAIAFVSASLMEGFGLPPLEAMSMSCPVVLSRIPSFQEVCDEAAIYFDPNDQNSLKDQLNFVYNLDQKRREEFIKKGLERVKQFSWEKMAKQTLAIYESSISIR